MSCTCSRSAAGCTRTPSQVSGSWGSVPLWTLNGLRVGLAPLFLNGGSCRWREGQRLCLPQPWPRGGGWGAGRPVLQNLLSARRQSRSSPECKPLSLCQLHAAGHWRGWSGSRPHGEVGALCEGFLIQAETFGAAGLVTRDVSVSVDGQSVDSSQCECRVCDLGVLSKGEGSGGRSVTLGTAEHWRRARLGRCFLVHVHAVLLSGRVSERCPDALLSPLLYKHYSPGTRTGHRPPPGAVACVGSPCWLLADPGLLGQH